MCAEALFGQAPYASHTMEQLLEKIANEQTIKVSSELGMGKGMELNLEYDWVGCNFIARPPLARNGCCLEADIVTKFKFGSPIKSQVM